MYLGLSFRGPQARGNRSFTSRCGYNREIATPLKRLAMTKGSFVPALSFRGPQARGNLSFTSRCGYNREIATPLKRLAMTGVRFSLSFRGGRMPDAGISRLFPHRRLSGDCHGLQASLAMTIGAVGTREIATPPKRLAMTGVRFSLSFRGGRMPDVGISRLFPHRRLSGDCHGLQASLAMTGAKLIQYGFVQVSSFRVHFIDQLILSNPLPTLDLLFPFQSRSNIGGTFKIDQSCRIVSCRKTIGIHVKPMLIYPSAQISRHACIEYGVCFIC